MSENQNKEKISEYELDQVLQFAQNLYTGFGNYGLYTPFSQNQNLLAINNNPKIPTYEKLVEAFKSEPYDNGLLSSYSEFMEVWDTIYSKTFRYLESLLSFDLTYTCKNIKDPKDYQSKEYKEDLKRVHKFLDNFDYKQEFKKVVKEVLRKETCYVWFRDSHEVIETPIELYTEENKIKKNEKFSLQIMPQNYCMLTGYFNSSQLLYDFNINYFLKANVDINLFAPSLKSKFKKAYDENKDMEYIPSAQLDYRNGEFANWVQCSPNDGAYAFKMDISNFRQVPPFANLMKSALNNDTIQQLQVDKDMISAYLILAGEIQLMDNLKSGDKKDQFAISPKTMGQFMNLVTSGLKKNVKPAAFPLTNIKGWQYNDQNPNMAKNHYETTAGQGVSAGSMIYTTGKMAQFEVENAILADYGFMKQLYLQFNQFLNFYINKKTVKYKFDFEFDGLDREFYRDYKTKRLKEYADKGIVLDETQWASALGIKPQVFHRSLECGHYSDFTQNLTMLLNANTMKNSGQESESGAPKKDNTEISDSGSLSHEYM